MTIFTSIQNRLRHTARHIVGQYDVDDILQEAFYRVWSLKNLPTDKEQVEKLTSTIVRNLSIDQRRRENRFDEGTQVKADTSDSHALDVRDVFDVVLWIVEHELNDTQRQVLWMRDYEGHSFEEIAQNMSISEENARQILSRARKIVRETYNRID